jgi:hypothetical protein
MELPTSIFVLLFWRSRLLFYIRHAIAYSHLTFIGAEGKKKLQQKEAQKDVSFLNWRISLLRQEKALIPQTKTSPRNGSGVRVSSFCWEIFLHSRHHRPTYICNGRLVGYPLFNRWKRGTSRRKTNEQPAEDGSLRRT